jgi:ABC-type multidrug transport system fused ATPase/permease subunit
MIRYRRFQDASISEKILDTMFLLTIGVGMLFALVYVYATHQGNDGKPGLSVADIRIAYYGKHQQTRLGAAINGPMSDRFDSPEQKQVILHWIDKGATEAGYKRDVAPIVNTHCIMCHSAEAGMGLPPLTSYAAIKRLTKTDTGASIESLVRVSHIHLFGISFILLFLGRIFLLCEMPVMLKRVTVAIPFLAMLADILSWFATKVLPGFAYVVMIAGMLLYLSIAVQIVVSLYQMWLYKPRASSEP